MGDGVEGVRVMESKDLRICLLFLFVCFHIVALHASQSTSSAPSEHVPFSQKIRHELKETLSKDQPTTLTSQRRSKITKTVVWLVYAFSLYYAYNFLLRGSRKYHVKPMEPVSALLLLALDFFLIPTMTGGHSIVGIPSALVEKIMDIIQARYASGLTKQRRALHEIFEAKTRSHELTKAQKYTLVAWYYHVMKILKQHKLISVNPSFDFKLSVPHLQMKYNFRQDVMVSESLTHILSSKAVQLLKGLVEYFGVSDDALCVQREVQVFPKINFKETYNGWTGVFDEMSDDTFCQMLLDLISVLKKSKH